MQGTQKIVQSEYVALQFSDAHHNGWWGYRPWLATLFGKSKFALYFTPHLLLRSDAEILKKALQSTDQNCQIITWELTRTRFI